ncbi:MAG TPA: NAD(P)H-hydrate dehydratase [Flavobacteriales bacterium]
MKLFAAQEIREWDQFTIKKHYENSADLMEVAAESVVEWLMTEMTTNRYTILCGTGNNGGDGLCIARLLAAEELEVDVVVVGDSEQGSPDFKLNLQRLLETTVPVKFLNDSVKDFHAEEHAILIDCLLGTGVNRPVEGKLAELIDYVNQLPQACISVDVPSGLIPDDMKPQSGSIIHAEHTLTFQLPKRAFLVPENYQFTGNFTILDIGLDEQYATHTPCAHFYYGESLAQLDFKPRSKFGYKNQYGHVRIVAGSKGKMGAAIMSARAAMRTGSGLVTASIPSHGLSILQTALPEVMCETDVQTDNLCNVEFDAKYSATALGPGIDQAPETALMLRRFLKMATHPLVLDADALNIIAAKNLFRDIPQRSILTPHVGEFDRLFGKHEHTASRIETMQQMSIEYDLIIVLKGAHTIVATPTGELYFNSTGNVGMATAGSGDVLTGVIVSLLGQGYSSVEAARFGVYLHGLAGDIAAEQFGYASMTAGDIIAMLPAAYDSFNGAYPSNLVL